MADPDSFFIRCCPWMLGQIIDSTNCRTELKVFLLGVIKKIQFT